MSSRVPDSRDVLGAAFLMASLWANSAAVPVVAADQADSPTVRTVVIGPQYQAGAFHRWLWGSDYRDLYATPVALPVLDLRTYAGGLTPSGEFGHGQTQALGFKGADGKNYTFRPVIKDPTGHLPAELRETLARRILIDQMASGHPAGHVVAPRLLQAAGILHNEPQLVVMPDDPALGEFQKQFANVAGDIEEWGGSAGFGGTTETIDGEEMWKRLRESPVVRADSRAYLKARLVDQLIGDWDRNRGQWRWGRVPGKDLWQPIPEDRDQAFVRFEGFFTTLLRPQLPLVVKFGPNYSSLAGLTFDGWDVDKRILADLEWPVWEAVAKELEAEVTDEAIEAAARLQPPEFFAKDGARMIAGLKSRRNGLSAQARRFYLYISKDVDVFCTDAHERVDAQRFENGDLELSVRSASPTGEPLGEPYFHRRFEAAVTKELRVYLYGGNDMVAVTGGHHGGVLLRVVGGDGVDMLDDSAGGGTRFSAAQDQSESRYRVVAGPGTHWDRRPYPPPPPNKNADWIPARDWGRMWGPLFLLSYGSDYGALIGGSLNTIGYGFRKDPWSDRQSLRLLYSTKEAGFRGTYLGEFRFENSRFRMGVGALGSGIEISRFFGSGNQTTIQGDEDTYKVEQDRFQLEPAVIYGPNANTDISLGLMVKHDTTEPRDNPVLSGQPFYGQGDFTQLGVIMRFRFDGTDGLALPRKGVFLNGAGRFYPALADVTDAFGEVHAEARGYLATPNERGITLALKAGGQKVFGTHPFFESAFIGGKTPFSLGDAGGGTSVRGLQAQRYAGDASLYGSADLYLPLTNAFVLVPGQLGVMGFFDVGRVFLDGETSERWHHGAGGGIFFTTPGRHNLVSLQVASSEGRTAVYLRAGFVF
jgi:Omp85 superfamily domain